MYFLKIFTRGMCCSCIRYIFIKEIIQRVSWPYPNQLSSFLPFSGIHRSFHVSKANIFTMII